MAIARSVVRSAILGGDTDVTERNSDEVIYIKGDENTDGSIRIIPDTQFSTEAEFQLRTNGVWNDTGILIAASTVYLGRELAMSGGGEFVITKDISEDIKSMLPHVRFDALTGTQQTVIVPSVGALTEDVIIQSDDTGEVSGSTIQFSGAATDLSLANKLILRTGTAAATGDVTVKLRRTSQTVGLFYQRTYPQSSFPLNTTVELTTDGLVELFAGETFFIELLCTGTLTLKADATNTVPYFGGDFYLLTEDEITPDDFGGVLSKVMINADGGILFNASAEPVLRG